MSFTSGYSKLKRSRQIIAILVKYGLDYFIDRSKIRLLTRIKRVPKSYRSLSLPKRFCLFLEELGPTFVKFGQILSTRPDFLPPDFIKELEKLQDQVHPFDSFKAKEIIENELGEPVSKLFKKFEESPIAAASLSQVHKATLPNGKTVAVKIQRPNIRQVIELDLEILEDMAEFVERRLSNGWVYHPELMVKEFKRAILREIDFTNEAHNFEKFRINFKDIDYIKVPKIYWEMTTTKVITMEFIEGTKVSNITRDEYKDIFDQKKVAKQGANMVLKQIFEDGFFHADPHPANIFIIPPATIVILDAGMVGYIDDNTIENGAKLLKAVMDKELDEVLSSLEALGILKGDFDKNLLRQDFIELIERYVGISLKELKINKLAQDTIEVIVRHNLTLPSNLALMIKALSMVETIGQQLDPDFNAVLVAKPFINKVVSKKFAPDKLLEKSSKLIQDSIELVEKLPQGLADTLEKIREGKLRIAFEHYGLEKLTNEINRASTLISLSVIIAAMVIGSSLVMQMHVSPYVFGYSILGIIGYVLAGILGLVLIISFLKSRR